jgi:WD40-like Beta Propeller Repeat
MKKLFLQLSLLFFFACANPYKYNNVVFPKLPVNLDSLNTIYDDYNSNIPYIGDDFPLYFSSNRASMGKQYDIIYYVMNIQFDRKTNELYLGTKNASIWTSYSTLAYLEAAPAKINTSFNELGPYAVSFDNFSGAFADDTKFLFFYANDTAGDLDIKFVRNFTFYDRFGNNTIAKAFNSSSDDAYPTFSPLTNEFYFCSNREGNFDIFKLAIPDLPNVVDFISNPDNANLVRKDTSLSGPSNDKFPFINNNVLVFASDRPGGFGGYDLYYSVLKDSIWSTPVNMGPNINSAFDECRPIIVQRAVFQNSLIIFSSNRPGGHGGFDLYYAGISVP